MNEIANVNTEQLSAPISAEEGMLLYTLTAGKTQQLIQTLFATFDEKVEEMRREFGDKVNQMSTTLMQIEKSQSEFEKNLAGTAVMLTDLKEQSGKLAKMMSDKPVTQTTSDADRWIAEMYSKINTIARRRRTVSGVIIGMVYKTMCSKYGVDVDVEYSKYRKVKNNSSRLNMCSANPTLRTRFEQALLAVAEDKTVNMAGSVLVNTMPREVREICQSLSQKPPCITFKEIYKEMCRRSGINLDEYIRREGDLQIPYKRFAKSYYVYQSKSLRPLFNEVVNDMRK